jgi:threonine/homoserine/homoserine lactone efflux protein
MEFIESILLGFSLAAIPGPIFFEVFRRTLIRGFWSGALLAVGEFLANALVLTLTFFGIYQFLLYKPIKLILFILGAAVIIWIGINAIKIKENDISNKVKDKVLKNNSILVGLGIGIGSPLTIAVWISIGGAYLAKYTSNIAAFTNIILLAFGVLLFFFALASLLYLAKDKIATKYIVWVSRIFGVVLFFYGFYFIYQFFKIILS